MQHCKAKASLSKCIPSPLRHCHNRSPHWAAINWNFSFRLSVGIHKVFIAAEWIFNFCNSIYKRTHTCIYNMYWTEPPQWEPNTVIAFLSWHRLDGGQTTTPCWMHQFMSIHIWIFAACVIFGWELELWTPVSIRTSLISRLHWLCLLALSLADWLLQQAPYTHILTRATVHPCTRAPVYSHIFWNISFCASLFRIHTHSCV